jgi:hypothetical protein
MKPEKKKKLREGDTMPLTPKGKRRVRRVSRRKTKQELNRFFGGTIVRNDVSQIGTTDTE